MRTRFFISRYFDTGVLWSLVSEKESHISEFVTWVWMDEMIQCQCVVIPYFFLDKFCVRVFVDGEVRFVSGVVGFQFSPYPKHCNVITRFSKAEHIKLRLSGIATQGVTEECLRLFSVRNLRRYGRGLDSSVTDAP